MLVLTLTPIEGPPGHPHADKLYHFLGFAVLALPCAALFRRALLWVVLVAVAQAGLIELVQPHIGRDAEWFDFWADLAGIAVGAGLGLWLPRQLPASNA
ncbi:VanZ family protein [Psychromarinibacter sp. C21-152]|uniref:VanZ family protein n=1 Tax=Psychromarinibacter sediminicola TaxID=3033385 RepID=A0AAE3NTV8_9RHOB|nr:VanZ family protein [Psychromarinibacter sediminicola]